MKNNRRKKQTSLQSSKLYDKVTQVETGILERLNFLKKTYKTSICSHFSEMKSSEPVYEASQNYYESFWKLYLSSEICRNNISQLETQIEESQEQILKIEGMFKKLEVIRNQGQLFRKKIRRKACEIAKQFICKYDNCDKSYGTKLALKYHQNLKHKKNERSYDSQS